MKIKIKENNMEAKGLTLSIIFEAESANYGEGTGNVTSLKKISRGNGESYTYISRQALRYNIVNQMGEYNTPLELDGSVLQFSPEASIKDYPEIDLFGYMKTIKDSKTRSAKVRLSHAIALESFNYDLDFLTNKGLLDRYNEQQEKKKEKLKKGGNIAQSEIHKSYYSYTITVDLDKIGKDSNNDEEINIENKEKSKRIINLLETVKFLYRDIKGRRENLSPLFCIGGIYNRKNPFFENRLKIENNCLKIEPILDVMKMDKAIENKTSAGIIMGIFDNDEEIDQNLKPDNMADFFKDIKEDIKKYYEQN
ncbi:MAG: type I-B CRISPR-associated protein Cas7/Cst2/DevR [Halanaerobiales bacterium]|nr:type I-B CRISPR-associated protein Cas7/Cst2/DevR [Halanaerobiales bacterium]